MPQQNIGWFGQTLWYAASFLLSAGLLTLLLLFSMPSVYADPANNQSSKQYVGQHIDQHAKQHNAQCFGSAQAAYQYLLKQDSVQKSDNKQQQNRVDNIQTININRASEAELTQLKGIGSKRAQDIILYREMMGGFMTVDELTNIKGIGQKTVDNNRQRLSIVD